MTLPSEQWRERANCIGADENMFFPSGTRKEIAALTTSAKVICGLCTVRSECLEYALTFRSERDRDGIFGGKTAKERRMIRRERRK